MGGEGDYKLSKNNMNKERPIKERFIMGWILFIFGWVGVFSADIIAYNQLGADQLGSVCFLTAMLGFFMIIAID